MKLSCLPVSFFKDIIQGRMSVFEWAQMAARNSLDAVDLSILFLPGRTHAEAQALRQQVAEAGLGVTMLCTYPDFTHPNAAQRQVELDAAIHSIALARELGAQVVRVTAGQAHPETSEAQGLEWAAEGLIQLAGQTRETGVTLLIENHAKPGAWQYTDFATAPLRFLQLANAVTPYGIRINFDTGNATAFADEPLALLEQVLPYVETVHASDTAVRGELKPVLLGTGITPFRKIFQRLERSGWNHWICIEEASFRGEAGVADAAVFVRGMWSQAGSQTLP